VDSNNQFNGYDNEYNSGTGHEPDAAGANEAPEKKSEKASGNSGGDLNNAVLPRSTVITDICGLALVLVRLAWRHKIITACAILFAMSFLPGGSSTKQDVIKSHQAEEIKQTAEASQPAVIKSVFDEPTVQSQFLKADNDQRIQSAARYLAESCGDDGRFVYEIDPHTGTEARAYSLSRHENTTLALIRYYEQEQSKTAFEAIQRALSFIEQNTRTVTEDKEAIFDIPGEAESLKPPRSSLGASAISLIALVEIEQVKPGMIPGKKLEAIAEHIRQNQKPDGSFYSVYSPHEGGYSDKPFISYHQHMACLAMAKMYEQTKEKHYMQSALKALDYLIEDDNTSGDYQYLIVLDEMSEFVKYTKSGPDKHYWHSVKVLNSVYRDMQRVNEKTSYSIPLGMMLEASRAGIKGIEPDHMKHYAEMPQRQKRVIKVLGKMQMGGKYSGAFIKGGIGRDRMNLRMNSTQHALSGLMSYQEAQPEKLAKVPN